MQDEELIIKKLGSMDNETLILCTLNKLLKMFVMAKDREIVPLLIEIRSRYNRTRLDNIQGG